MIPAFFIFFLNSLQVFAISLDDLKNHCVPSAEKKKLISILFSWIEADLLLYSYTLIPSKSISVSIIYNARVKKLTGTWYLPYLAVD